MVDSEIDIPANIIQNHDFSSGQLEPWKTMSCHGYVVSSASSYHAGISAKSGGCYAVITNRNDLNQGVEQDITARISPGSIYSVSAWVGISNFVEDVTHFEATLRLEYLNSEPQHRYIGSVLVSKEEWKKLEGVTFSLSPLPDRVVLYFKGPTPGVDLLIDSVVVSEIPRAVPSRDGNIILNSQFEDCLNNWSGRHCKILVCESMDDGTILPLSGKLFASTTLRRHNFCGIQQDISAGVQPRVAYEVTAVVRVFGNKETEAEVQATLWVRGTDLREYYVNLAKMQATDKEWKKLQGQFLLNGAPSTVVIYLEGPPEGTDILVDSFAVKRVEDIPPAPMPDFTGAAFGVNVIEYRNLNKNDMNGWFAHKNCILEVRTGSPRVLPPMARDSLRSHIPLNGRYIFVTDREDASSGPAQLLTDKLKLFCTYQTSAWVQIGPGAMGPQCIKVTIRIDGEHGQELNGGQVEATEGCWREVSGSFRIEKQPSKILVYVHCPSASVNFMVAALQIFPVNRKARFDHLKAQTEKIRMRDVILKFDVTEASSLPGTYVEVRQISNDFPFGSCISKKDRANDELVKFFVKNFNWAVFGNELKWHSTEPHKGESNYKDADELLDLCRKENIETRGHCIFEEVEDNIQSWIRSLKKNDLKEAVESRLTDLLTHFKGKFRHYTVNNEMLHGSFYEDRLGKASLADMFKKAHELDKSATLFVNDCHVEDGSDARSSPEKYIQQIVDLIEQGAPIGGIGIEGHIDSPIGQIVCSALDNLGTLGLPIWITELDVSSMNEYIRADDLEVMLRECFAHPAVNGIMLWRLRDLVSIRDNANLAGPELVVNKVGNRYLALRKEWLSHYNGYINDQGEARFKGFHGTYMVKVGTSSEKFSKTFVVNKGTLPLEISITS